MFTKNFMKLMAMRLFNIYGYSQSSYPKLQIDTTVGTLSVVQDQGSSQYTTFNGVTSSSALNFAENVAGVRMDNSQFRLSLMCGTGTTLPTISDNTLESVIPRTSLQVQQHYYDPNTVMDEQKLTYTSLQKNISGGELTINELGLYTAATCSSSTGTGANITLIWREVLKTPIIIPAGKSKSITVTLDFSKING